MDEKPSNFPGVPDEQYHTLGRKTFMVFLLERVQPIVIFLIIVIALFWISGQPFLRKTPVGDITNAEMLVAWGALILWAAIFAIIYFVSWLIYRNYKFYLGENALKIKRGVLNKEEVAIPYRQIQDVDLDRNLSYRMLGLSRIMILTAGEDEEKLKDDESEGILPALDKDLAEWLQKELLNRTNIQKVTEVPQSQQQ